MRIDDLASQLAAHRPGVDPDGWAMAAYRLAVAKSELASRPEHLVECVELLELAGRILTAERAPVEHSRILTATASCHRAAGRPDLALPLFESAATLATGRAPGTEAAAALVNLGLARAEGGDPAAAIDALDRAIGALDAAERTTGAVDAAVPATGDVTDAGPTTGDVTEAGLTTGGGDGVDPARDDEVRRLRGAALVNRAQAHQAAGHDDAVTLAVADYRAGLAVLAPESPQAGMAAHGLGAALLELDRRAAGGAGDDRGSERLGDPPLLDEAIAAFERSLGVFGPAGHPLQHAVARHSLAVAHERRARAGDLARALDGLEAALSLFDPRLHRAQWQTTAESLERVEAALDAAAGPQARAGHVIRFLASTTSEEREQRLADRLRRLSAMPPAGRDPALDSMARAMADLPTADHSVMLRATLSVLMTLPEPLLEAAAIALVAANAGAADPEARDRLLDDAVHDTLFGPQRVRVRDLLEAAGWVRP